MMTKNSRQIKQIVGIALVASLCFAAVAVRADDDVEQEERQTQLDASGTSVRYESQLETATAHTKFIWGLEFEGQPRIMARYRAEIESSGANDAEELQTEERLRIRMIGLLEYANDPAVSSALEYEEGDTIVTNTRFDRVAWTDFDCTDVQRDNVTVTKCSSSFEDGTTDVTFDMYVASGAFLATPSTLVPPRSLKFDVTINGYEYAAAGEYLALVYRVESAGSTKVDNDEDNTVHRDSSERWSELATDAKLAFSWAGAAAGVDAEIPVQHTVLTPRLRCDVGDEETDEGESRDERRTACDAEHGNETDEGESRDERRTACDAEHGNEADEDKVGTDQKKDDIIAFSFLAERATYIHWDPLLGENYNGSAFPIEILLIVGGIVAVVGVVAVAGVAAIVVVRVKRGASAPSASKL